MKEISKAKIMAQNREVTQLASYIFLLEVALKSQIFAFYANEWEETAVVIYVPY